MSRRGITVIQALGALVLMLLLVAAFYFLIQRFVVDQPTAVLTDVVSCSSLGNLVGQGQCLRDSHCEGRPGWGGSIKTTVFCPESRPYCCFLKDKDRDEYFAQGSLVISYGDEDYKLDPDSKEYGHEVIDLDEEGTGRSKDRVTMKKGESFSVYYVPRLGDSGKADETCSLKEKVTGHPLESINDCYKQRESTFTFVHMVLLWTGKGEEFMEAIGDEKGKQQPASGYGFKMITTKQADPSRNPEEVLYSAALKIEK